MQFAHGVTILHGEQAWTVFGVSVVVAAVALVALAAAVVRARRRTR